MPRTPPQSASIDALFEATFAATATLDERRALAAFQQRLVGRADAPVRLGRYVLGRRLGVGGLGIVYEADDPELRRKVAIKVLHGRGLQGSGARKRLSKEAQAIARVSHPNVVAIYDVGTYRPAPQDPPRSDAAPAVFIAMELVDGPSLRTWLRERPRTWSLVVRVFVAAARGLAAAHDAGLVHRDFKPENVLVGPDDSVKVADFGLARAIELAVGEIASGSASSPDPNAPVVATLSPDNAFAGTPAYMAPEQLEGGVADARSDQFSFFVALYEALYGQRPFEGTSIRDLAQSIADGPTKVASRMHVPGWLAEVVTHGLAVDPQARFGSMREVIDALERRGTRRRTTILAVAGVAAAAAGLAWAFAGHDQAAACAAAGDLEQVWNAERARIIGDTMHDTGLRYADDTWVTAKNAIDAYVATWSEVRARICRAGHEGSAADTEVLDLRLACLQRGSTELDALLEVFETADAEVVDRVGSAVGRLPDVQRCPEAEAGESVAPLPIDPQLRAAVAQLERRLARVRALEYAGRYDEGVEQAREALASAKKIAHPPVVVEAEYRVGIMLILSGDPARAQSHLREAFWKAWENGGDRFAAAAAIKLLSIPGLGAEDVESWRRYAEAAIERGRLEDSIAARLHIELGGVGLRRADARQAARDFARARELLAEAGPEHESELATAMNNEAAALFRLDRADQAIELTRRALRIRRRLWGDRHPQVGTSLLNLATIELGERRYAAAAASFDEAIEHLRSVLGDDNPKVALALLNRGVLRMYQGPTADALSDVDRAMALWQAAAPQWDPHVVRALDVRVTILLALERIDEAVSAANEAVDLADRMDTDPRLRAMAHEGRARAYLASDRLADARRDIDVAVDVLAAIDDGNDAAFAAVLLTACRAAMAAGELEVASARCADARAKMPADDHGPLGELALTMAQLEQRRGRQREARRHARQARAHLAGAEPYYQRLLPKLRPWPDP